MRSEALSPGELYSLPDGEQGIYIYEGFHEWGYPKMDGLQWKTIFFMNVYDTYNCYGNYS